jgi:hypothetical protein
LAAISIAQKPRVDFSLLGDGGRLGIGDAQPVGFTAAFDISSTSGGHEAAMISRIRRG